MTDPLDILRARSQRLDAEKTLRTPSQRTGGAPVERPKQGAADIAQAVAVFNAAHPVHELLEAAGVELAGYGVELYTVNGCPLVGCASSHNAFRVHIDRNPGDPRGPQWCCRKCGRGGDALRLALHLAGRNPSEWGETARFLRERGYLQSPDSRAKNRGRTPARTPESPPARSGRVKAGQTTFPRKGTPENATKNQEPRPSAKGQVPRVPAPLSGEGQATPPASSGRPPRLQTREGQAVPADPLRWFRPDALAAFGRRPTPDEIEALDERAGIVEFDAGLTRQDAEHTALREVVRRDNL